MEKSLFRFIWKYSTRQQIIILLITFVSFPIVYLSLELPKQIVNDAIAGRDFPRGILGIELTQIQYLLILCFTFLSLVVLNNAVKYVLNIYKGLTGERMLRRLRYDLYQRVLRFRLPYFRNVSSGEIIPMITSEVEPVGGFIGDSIAVPAFYGGTLMVYIVFIFVQDPFLGIAAIALYPIQAYLIPKLQYRVNMLAKQRVQNVRRIADRVGESISGVAEIHANDTSAWHMADISDRLHTNFEIRYAIFKRKFMIKFVNNFINQLTPFFFYSIGGYLVIVGNISFGSLVAVIAAYKDLASPWKELLNYYQNLMDVRVKYDSVIENFDPPDIYPVERIVADADDGPRLTGNIEFINVGYSAGGGQELTDVNLSVGAGSTVAVVGHDGSGRTELLQLAAGLISPNSGKVTIGGQETDALPEARLGRDIAFVDRSAFIFTDTIRGNLHYGMRNRPVRPEDTPLDPSTLDYRRTEAEATNNTVFDINAGWEDLERVGAVDHSDLDRRTIELIDVVGLSEDIYRLGMRMRVLGDGAADLRDRILRARKEVTARISADSTVADLVEIWTPDRFLRSAPLVENLLFALPADPDATIADIAADTDALEAISAANLRPELHRIGLAIAETMVDLFAEVDADNQLLAAFSFIKPDELPHYDRMVKKAHAGGIDALDEDQRSGLIGLAFQLIPAKHRLGLIDDALAERFVAARPVFQKRLADAGRYAFFDRETYIDPLSIEENLLFGKIKLDRRGAREGVDAFVDSVIREIDLREPIMRRGLDFHAGVAGSRLTGGQKSRIALARALLKKPNILLFDDVITPDAADDRAMLGAITRHHPECTVLVGVERLDDAGAVDHIVTMKGGRVAENRKTQRQAATSTEPAQ